VPVTPFVIRRRTSLSPMKQKFAVLDIDVFSMDNSVNKTWVPNDLELMKRVISDHECFVVLAARFF
jgi:hypothetical protein